MSNGSGYGGQAKVIVDNKSWDTIMKSFADEKGIRIIDITPDKLRLLKVKEHNIESAMKSVVRKICEFYGIKLWELQSSGIDFVEKYGITKEHLEIIGRYGDIGVAYNNYVKQYIGEDIDGRGLNRDISFIPKAQVVQNIDETQIMKKLRNQEKYNLEMLIKSEPDEKKKKLYQIQLEALNLKDDIENDG